MKHFFRIFLLLACIGAFSADRSLAQDALPDIRHTLEYETFYGLNDMLTAPSLWEGQLLRWAGDMCALSRRYRNVLNSTEALLPGEGLSDRMLAVPGSDLFQLVGPGLVTDRQANVYTRASAPYEEVLFKRLAEMGPQTLTPGDVIEMALEVTKGNYGLAVLTLHYVFKATAFQGRAVVQALQRKRAEISPLVRNSPNRPSARRKLGEYLDEYEKGRKLLAQFNIVVQPLKSLRVDPSATPDKMGPWYHIFALLSIDAYGGSGQTILAGIAEHGAKRFRLFENEGGYNREKAQIDAIFSLSQSQCRNPAPFSTDPSPPAIPDLTGMTVPEAEKVLDGLGIRMRAQRGLPAPDRHRHGRIYRQSLYRDGVVEVYYHDAFTKPVPKGKTGEVAFLDFPHTFGGEAVREARVGGNKVSFAGGRLERPDDAFEAYSGIKSVAVHYDVIAPERGAVLTRWKEFVFSVSWMEPRDKASQGAGSLCSDPADELAWTERRRVVYSLHDGQRKVKVTAHAAWSGSEDAAVRKMGIESALKGMARDLYDQVHPHAQSCTGDKRPAPTHALNPRDLCGLVCTINGQPSKGYRDVLSYEFVCYSDRDLKRGKVKGDDGIRSSLQYHLRNQDIGLAVLGFMRTRKNGLLPMHLTYAQNSSGKEVAGYSKTQAGEIGFDRFSPPLSWSLKRLSQTEYDFGQLENTLTCR